MQFTTFTTAVGTVGLVWSGNRIERVVLPAASLAALRTILKNTGAQELQEPTKLPTFVKKTIRAIERHLVTGRENLSEFANLLNLNDVPSFHQKIYQALLKVPTGKTVTYKDLARRANSPLAARAAGQAMAKNRFPLLVPCHRVIKTSGDLGNFSAHEGTALKAKLLHLEKAL